METPNISSLEDLVKSGFKHLGLDSFTVRVEQSSFGQYHFMLATTRDGFDIRSSRSIKDVFDYVFKPIFESVEKSNFIQDALAEMRLEVKELLDKQKKLEAEIERLKPFESYFKVQYELNHGEKK